ncbi:MAG: hypothetical protein H5U17_04525 [Defluviimonas sp.]|nr:hypothetical protein [Defluviimonas sp.]
MLIDLISLIALGALIACVYVAVNRMTGRRLPRWLLPAALGAGMIGFAVWNEYTWYSRVTAELPESVAVVLPVRESSFWRPWSYVVPMVTRFIAVDRGAVMRSAQRPGLVRTDAILVQRWTPTQRVPVAFDCTAARRADLAGGADLAADGTLTGGDWVALAPDDPFMLAACQGG